MSTVSTDVIERGLVAEAYRCPSGVGPDGTAGPEQPVPPVSGFVESAFSPMVNAVVADCVRHAYGDDGLGGDGASTALVLTTSFGDAITSDLASRLLGSGKVQNPLLFFQSVPTTILGVVARDHGILGPTTCVSVRGDLRDESLDLVDAVLADDDVHQVLLVALDLAAADRPRRALDELGIPADEVLPDQDAAVAFLIRENPGGTDGVADSVALPPAGPGTAPFGALTGLVGLYHAARRARESGAGGPLDVDATAGRSRLRLLVAGS